MTVAPSEPQSMAGDMESFGMQNKETDLLRLSTADRKSTRLNSSHV